MLPFRDRPVSKSTCVNRITTEFPDGYMSPLSTAYGKDAHRDAPLLHSLANFGTNAFRSRSHGSGHDPSRFGNVNEESW